MWNLICLIFLWVLSTKQNLYNIGILQNNEIRCMLRFDANCIMQAKFSKFKFQTPYLFICDTFLDEKIILFSLIYIATGNRFNPSIQHRLKMFGTKPPWAGPNYFPKLPALIVIIVIIVILPDIIGILKDSN